MAISEINAALDIISKLTIALIGIRYRYNRSSEEIQAFSQKVKIFTEKRSEWEQLLEKYRLPLDHLVITRLKDAVKLLDEQVQDVEAMQMSNGCCRIWNKTWSSDTLITNLRSVDNAFNNIFDCLKQKQQEEQAVEHEADKIKAPFSFIPDKKYVPIKQTVEKICRALETDDSIQKVVLLHGGSGEGKSSLAKYLALHYHKNAKGGSTSSNSCRFSNRVVFISCGPNADSLSLMQKLSVDLGYSLDASKVRVQMDGTERRADLDDLKRKLIYRLENGKSILIILDDVWDQQLIADLMMPLKDVTYLITSQLKLLWSDAVEYVSIDSPTADEAREILTNHIVGWKGKPFPLEVQGEVDLLIENVQNHPLVLANLATLIKWEKVPDLNTWIWLRKELKIYIQLADEANIVSRPVVFGEPYKHNLVASLTMAIKLISDNARSLLFMLALCTTNGVHENVLRLWFKVLHGSNMAMFNAAYADLCKHSLISTAETKILLRDETHTICSIHDLRRELIREMNEGEVEEILEKLLGRGIARRGKEHVLSGRSEEDLAAALCFVYGDVAYSQKAQSRIEIDKDLPSSEYGIGWVLDLRRKSTVDLVKGFAELIHPTFEDACDWEKAIHELAKTVILHLLQFTELKDEAVSKLLDIPQAFLVTCSALMHTRYYYDISKIPMTIKKLVKALHNLADVRPEFVHHLNICLSAVCYCTCLTFSGLSWTLVQEPDLLNVLRKVLHWPSSGSLSNNEHPYLGVLNILSVMSQIRDCRIKVATAPEMLKTLLWLLGSNFHTNQFLLERSVEIFLKVGCSDPDVKASIISLPDVFKMLVGLLSITPKPALQALEELSWTPDSAGLVASCPGALEGLVDLLTDSSQPTVQCKAVQCLGAISSFRSTRTIIASTCPRAVQSVIQLAHQDSSPELLAQIAKFVRKIIFDDTEVEFGISEKILTEVLRRLYLLLAENVDVTVRNRAMGALGTLASEEVTCGDLEAYPELPEHLINVYPYTNVNDDSMKIVNNAFRRMFEDGKSMEESSRMALGAHAVKMYTGLLQAHDINYEVQRCVAERLGIISRRQEFCKIVADARGEKVIIKHMWKRDPAFYISKAGIHVVEDIIFEAADLTNLERPVLVSQVLEFYTVFFRDGFEIQTQEYSLRAIAVLTHWLEIRKLLAESDETIELLLAQVTKKASPFTVEYVAKIIHRVLCSNCDEIQRRTFHTKTLRRYVALLVNGIKANIPEAAVVGFMILGSREEIRKIISADERIVNLVLGLLTEHTTTKTLRSVAYLLQNILVKGPELETSHRMTFINRALRSLVELLSDGIHTTVHAGIVQALGSLAFTYKSNKVIVAFSEVLNQLTHLLKKVEVRAMLVHDQVLGVVQLASACEMEEQDLNEDMLGLRRYFLQCYMSIMEDDTNDILHEAAAKCLATLLMYETNRKLFVLACPDGQVYLRQYVDRRCGLSLGYVTTALTLLDPIKAGNFPLEDYYSLHGRGWARAWLNQYKSSMEDYVKAVGVAPKGLLSNILMEQSFIKVQLGDLAGALDDLNQAICTKDKLSQFDLQERGILKYMVQDYNGALSDLNESLRLHPDHDDYEVLKHRGYVKFCLGDEDGARFDAQQAICKHFSECTIWTHPQGAMCLGGLPVKYLEYEL